MDASVAAQLYARHDQCKDVMLHKVKYPDLQSPTWLHVGMLLGMLLLGVLMHMLPCMHAAVRTRHLSVLTVQSM